VNICSLVGRIGTDPDMRYAASGTPVVNFTLGVKRRVRSASAGGGGDQVQQDTDWIRVVAFGKTAEFVSQYLDKGAHIGVVGSIRSRKWETQDGQRRETVEVVADNIEFMESRAEAEARRAGGGGRGPSGGGGGRGGGMGDNMPPPEELELPPDEEIFGDL
jgi:single-strand DNA-binding protein